MADSKISDLAAVTDVLATDEYVLARSGTTKKIDASNLLVASEVAFTPVGTIAATDVQTAIAEVATEAAGGTGVFDAYAYYRDQQTANTQGGSSTSGSWLTRVLNTEVFDPAGIGTLTSNHVTLAAGTYFLEAHAPFGTTGSVGGVYKIRIRDTTNNVTLANGSQQLPGAVSASFNNSCLVSARGRATLSGSTNIEVQYQCQNSIATSGLGWAANMTEVEVYAELMIWREA